MEGPITGSMAATAITDARYFRAAHMIMSATEAALSRQNAYFPGSLTKATLLRPAFEASASVSATKR